MSDKQQNDRLIYLVLTAQHRLKLHIKDALLAAGVKITLVQAGILFLLAKENDQAMTKLSGLLFLDKSTITGLIDRLEKAGYVLRQPNPADRRVFLIRITPQGAKEAKKAAKVINRINQEIKTGFSKDEIELFKKVLSGIITTSGDA